MTDGQGYYAYLPAVFIYQDLQFSFVDSINQLYYPEGKRAKFIIETPTGNVNKYFAGTAVLEAPFFMLGCLVAKTSGVPVDGYSWPFQLIIGLAAIAYLVLGLFLLAKFLTALGFENRAVTLTVLLVFFGTNLFYYTIYEPSMSHAYSLFTVSAFLFFVERACSKKNVGAFVGAAAMLGLTVLIRPTNAIVLLGIPLATNGLQQGLGLAKSFIGNTQALLASAGLLVLIVFIQPLVYFVQTGHWLVWSYEGEGFDFLNPELINVLFSYRKGLFVYCPILLLSFLGIVPLALHQKPRAIWLTATMLVCTWVISSWWMWYYGGSFGHRAFIDFYPFYAVGLAALLSYGLAVIRPWASIILGMTLVPLQMVQTYQYNQHIITFDNMNKTKYWNLFLRTGDDLAWYYSGYPGQDSYSALDSMLVMHTFEYEQGWGNEHQLIDDSTVGEGRIARMGIEDGFGPTFRKQVDEIPIDVNSVRISAWVNSDTRASNVSFVCSIEDSTGAAYYWHKYPLRPQFKGTGNWSRATSLFRCGKPRSESDVFVIYPMKSDGSTVLFDDMEISFVHAK